MELITALMGFGIFSIIGVVAFIVLAVVAAEMDSAMLAAATFILGAAAIEFFTDISLITLAMTNPLYVIAYIVGWVVIGVMYVYLWRFPEYIRDEHDDIERKYRQWANNQTNAGENNSFDGFLESNDYSPWTASNNKSRLGTWVGLWVFSLFWELSRKPFLRGWDFIYNSCGKMFEKAGARAARRAHEKT